ncbi:MAG TPA: exodeoxyribonuclease III [Acidimicrobiales bacterium]|nr:exodeoxyribonuclease III [Acidimicrobiales bacterium]
MRFATWNVNSLKARLSRVEEWLAYASPDVVCLQETKLADAAFPAMSFQLLGYESAHHGTGRWNGVAILSRVGLDEVVAGFSHAPEDEAVESRLITATCAGVRVSSVYVPNGRSVGSEHYEAKLAWLEDLRRHVAGTCDPEGPVLLCGDFNVASDDRDVWDPARAHGGTHVSEPERAAIRALEEWGLRDAFRLQHPEGRLFSWWDYRAGDFHNHRGMRIDLMLVSRPLAGRVTFALIDRNARKGKLPSDHAPLVVDIDLEGANGHE